MHHGEKQCSLRLWLSACAVAFAADQAAANIYQWEWVDHTSPGSGKAQSSSLCADGAGVSPVPYANLMHRDLTQAYLCTVDLTSAALYWSNLTNADLTNAQLSSAGLGNSNLTNAVLRGANISGAAFYYSTLTNADFTDATGAANFSGATGFTLAQLYSMAGYKAHNLSGIGLSDINLSNVDLRNQNLSYAALRYAGTSLANADLSGATITGVDFDSNSTLAKEQLYSTASYQAHDLHDISLRNLGLNGWNFARQNLRSANFGVTFLLDANCSGAIFTRANFAFASIAHADLRDASLVNADFTSATFSYSDLTGADLRGAKGVNLQACVVANTILPDGSVAGLHLTANQSWTVRNTENSLPIRIHNSVSLDAGSGIEIVLDGGPAWNSIIQFDPNEPVSLAGTLRLTLDPTADSFSLIGVPQKLFDWTGVSPAGTFNVVGDPGMQWDTRNLYSTGEITLVAVPEPTLLLATVGPAIGLLLRRRRGECL